jgi:phosphoglycerate dehydrogenase-like enzyme
MIHIAVLDDYQHAAPDFGDWNRLATRATIDFFDSNLGSVEEAAHVLAPFDVLCLMRERMPMPLQLIERLPNLKLIVVTGGRTRSLDKEAARQRGILVTHTRSGDSPAAPLELAWGLILALMRHIPLEHDNMRHGLWQTTVGRVLAGKTLGLLGLGKLGAAMVPVARAFGMEVQAWSPNLTPERAAAAGARAVSKEALFAESDIVSLHIVLSESTRGVIGAADLRRMRSSALLINTSRGPLVDESALLEALHEKRIAGAGLDVFDVEPLPPDHPLRQTPNVVLTPHLGFVTEGTYRQFFADMVEIIAAWESRAPLPLFANPG